MIYLDSGATTLEKPPAVARAMAQAVGEMSSPGRGIYPASQKAARTAYDCREAAAELFHVPAPEQVIFRLILWMTFPLSAAPAPPLHEH